jgi:hypothetical protein
MENKQWFLVEIVFVQQCDDSYYRDYHDTIVLSFFKTEKSLVKNFMKIVKDLRVRRGMFGFCPKEINIVITILNLDGSKNLRKDLGGVLKNKIISFMNRGDSED